MLVFFSQSKHMAHVVPVITFFELKEGFYGKVND